MSMRSDWVAAKARAKRFNNNVDVKFPRDLELGQALDKVEAAKKVFEKAGEKEHNAAWAKAGDAYY